MQSKFNQFLVAYRLKIFQSCFTYFPTAILNKSSKIHVFFKAFESSVYIDANLTQNWLRDFLDYVDRNKGYADVQLPIQTEQEFAQTLKNVYLADPNNPARLDVTFSQDGQKVEAARFLIQVNILIVFWADKNGETIDICTAILGLLDLF